MSSRPLSFRLFFGYGWVGNGCDGGSLHRASEIWPYPSTLPKDGGCPLFLCGPQLMSNKCFGEPLLFDQVVLVIIRFPFFSFFLSFRLF